MARGFNNKDKDLVKLKVVTSQEVWNKQSNGKYVLNKDLDIYGRVEKGTSAFITNLFGEKSKFDKHFSFNLLVNVCFKFL